MSFLYVYMYVYMYECMCVYGNAVVETNWYKDKKTIPLAAYENICRHYIVN